jgi:hypothetical protein
MAQVPFIECGVYGSSTTVSRDAESKFVLHVNRPVDNPCISPAMSSITEQGVASSSTNVDGDTDCPSMT